MVNQSLAIVRCVLSSLIAVLGIIGFCIAVWHSVDFGSIHEPLWEISQRQVGDDHLLSSLYVMSVLCLSTPLFVLIDRWVTAKQGHRTIVSSAAVRVLGAVWCALTIVALVGLVAAAVASSGVLLHSLSPTISNMIANFTFMRREPSARWIYTEEGMLINYMQAKFECCGNIGYLDYKESRFPERHEREMFPYSCCHLKEGSDWRDPDLADVRDLFLCQSLNPDSFHDQGCLEVFQAWLKSKADFLVALGSFLAFLCVALFISYAYLIYESGTGQPF